LGVAKLMAERNGVPIEIQIIRGGVAKRIIKTAQETNADVIVLGETGRTGLKRLGMGSIAETVIKGSETPVFVIK
jgi:nucleotide-binding universal stress UspA family protein